MYPHKVKTATLRYRTKLEAINVCCWNCGALARERVLVKDGPERWICGPCEAEFDAMLYDQSHPARQLDAARMNHEQSR